MKYLNFLLIIGLFIVGCSQQNNDLVKTESDLCMKASRLIIGKLSKDLKSELSSAMKEGGAISAIEVCLTKANNITDKHSAGKFVSIKRVSDKNRNPENLADSTQLEILQKFYDDNSMTNNLSMNETKNGRTFTYYKVIKTNPLCLQCHGKQDEIDNEVMKLILDSYPEDKAIGYTANQVRGMFVVEIQMPQAKEFLEKLMAESDKQ